MILLPDCYDNIIEIQTWNFKLTDEYNENLIGLFRDFFPLQNGCANRDIKGWVLTPVNMEMKGSDRSKDNLFASTFTTGSSALFIFILYLRFFSLFFFSFIFSSLTDLSIFFKLLLPRGFVFSQRYRISESDAGPTANSPPQRIIN